MRWQGQKITADQGGQQAQQKTGEKQNDAGPLLPLAGLVRSVKTPEFHGVTFHEVAAKSALNKVPPGSNMPFTWTINPMRGCTHQCVYCFARKTHEYLELDSGKDFDSQIVVKTNIAQVLTAELARQSWKKEHVALGTNTDPYQRAEGRYQLMPGIIRALADSGTGFSILTKGPLLKRDLPLLKQAAKKVPVSVAVSLAFMDPELQQKVEPGTPDPRARLNLIRAISNAGLQCRVMAMPILPWLTDSTAHLDQLHEALAEAGASWVTLGALHLRPGAREWYLGWLQREFPALVPKYRRIYRSARGGFGSYAIAEYRKWLDARAAEARHRHGFTAQAEPVWRERSDPAEPNSISGQSLMAEDPSIALSAGMGQGTLF